MNNQGDCLGKAETGWRIKWRKFWGKVWEHFFGDIPNIHESKTIEFRDNKPFYIASFVDDSFYIGVGFHTEWLVILRRTTLHKLIFWYLWRFAYGEWFGLRRYLFYKFLHRRCEKIKKFGKK